MACAVPQIVTANRPILALLAQLSSEPLQLQVRGTVSQPQLQLPEGASLLDEISKRVAPAQYEEAAPSLSSAISDIIQDAGNTDKEQARKDLPGNILNIIRAVDQAKKSQTERPRQKSRKR